MDVNVDVGALTRAEFESRAYAVKCSLGEDWTLEEVRSLTPAGIVTRIADRVYEMSGIQPEQAADLINFRKEPGRDADSKPKPGGLSSRR